MNSVDVLLSVRKLVQENISYIEEAQGSQSLVLVVISLNITLMKT